MIKYDWSLKEKFIFSGWHGVEGTLEFFSVLNFSSLVPLQLFGQVFVVAIILALVSSIFVLPALYTPFLKMDARKILSEKNSISESE